jgi:beta-phosphoglucomutase
MIPENCKAIIFDMDGVLWNSSKIHYEAYCKSLIEEGLSPPLYQTIAGRRTRDVMHDICKEQIKDYDDSIVTNLTRKKQHLANKELNRNPPIPDDCKSTLKKLSTKYILALATSGSCKNTKIFLDSSGSEEVFKSILCGDNITSAKPDPEIYLITANRLNLKSSECIVIEDSLSGILSANNAGMRSIAITGTHNYSELELSTSILIINNLNELCQD